MALFNPAEKPILELNLVCFQFFVINKKVIIYNKKYILLF
jgi:hypothetical protein